MYSNMLGLASSPHQAHIFDGWDIESSSHALRPTAGLWINWYYLYRAASGRWNFVNLNNHHNQQCQRCIPQIPTARLVGHQCTLAFSYSYGTDGKENRHNSWSAEVWSADCRILLVFFFWLVLHATKSVELALSSAELDFHCDCLIATALCKAAPPTRFLFLHITYSLGLRVKNVSGCI